MKLIIIFFISILLFSCTKEIDKSSNSTEENILSIKLKQSIDDDFYFYEFRYTDFPIFTQNHKFPRLYKDKFKKFKGIPKLDSFQLVTSYFQYSTKMYELYKNNYLNEGNYDKTILNDSLTFLKKTLDYQINIVTGFKKNKQIVIVDSNNNNDFSDDRVLEFDENFRLNHNNSREIIDKLPILDFYHKYHNGNQVFDFNRKIQIFPYTNHPHSYLIGEEVDELSNNYTLMMRLKDYYRSSFKVSNIKYTVAIQGKNIERLNVIIKPDSIVYDKYDISFQKSFEYYISDTVKLANNYYKIDSISNSFKYLYFTKLNKNFNPSEYRFGDKISDYTLSDLSGNKTNLSSVIDNNKKYTFIDFWGTWCAPCLEHLPELKELHNDYSSSINFIGVALDENPNKVSEFITKNNIDWFNAFVNREDRKGTIISGLKVTAYPTYILLNENFEIVYRGGTSSLKDFRELLRKL